MAADVWYAGVVVVAADADEALVAVAQQLHELGNQEVRLGGRSHAAAHVVAVDVATGLHHHFEYLHDVVALGTPNFFYHDEALELLLVNLIVQVPRA